MAASSSRSDPSKIELDREQVLGLLTAHDRFLSLVEDAVRGIIAKKDREQLESWFEEEGGEDDG
jgi:hypothetical protein